MIYKNVMTSERVTNLIDNERTFVEYDSVNECPICKTVIIPIFIAASLNSGKTVTIFEHCPKCNRSFVTAYEIKATSKTGQFCTVYADKVLYTAPYAFVVPQIPDEIRDLSERFVKIYTQASQADSEGLDEIAGPGYRKAIEILIKDFLMHKNAADESTIKRTSLGNCIDNYIKDPTIHMLAKKSTWIGNDETHYARVYEDRTIEDMKRFIKALMNSISTEIIYEDAESMVSKKIP